MKPPAIYPAKSFQQLNTDYVTVQDYPMRGRPVYLHMRKNKWWDKKTNEIFSYNLELPNEEGTRLSAEFVTFLKDEGWDDSFVHQAHSADVLCQRQVFRWHVP